MCQIEEISCDAAQEDYLKLQLTEKSANDSRPQNKLESTIFISK